MNKRVENIIKRMLRKWLKKRIAVKTIPIGSYVSCVEWVYQLPLSQWRDGIWSLEKGGYIIRYAEDYLSYLLLDRRSPKNQ